MSKYFVEKIMPRPAPTFEERAEEAIRDLEKRIERLERKQKDDEMSHRAEDFAKARAYEIAKAEGRI